MAGGGWVYKTNGFSVRVPHNVSRRMFSYRTPNPLLVAGGWWLAVAGSIKPWGHLGNRRANFSVFFNRRGIVGLILPLFL